MSTNVIKMRKVLLVFSAVTLIGLTSCNKCTTCTKEGEEDQIECKESQGPWESAILGDSYQEDVNYWLEQGYECD